MLRLKCLIVAAALALSAGPANAVTFNWSYVGGFSAGGTLEATPSGPGTYLVTSITGTDSLGDAVSGPHTSFGADNILYYPASPPAQVDASGIGFLLSGTLTGALVAYLGAGVDLLGGCLAGFGCSSIFDAGFFSASPAVVAAVPLPAALPLFATGLGVIGLLARRRKRQTSAAA